MKLYLLIISLFLSSLSFSQNEETPVLFAQCMFDIADTAELELLQSELEQLDFVKVVRLDIHTQRSFILFKNKESLSSDELKDLFGEYRNTIYCVQIGIYGTDAINRFPFTNCQ